MIKFDLLARVAALSCVAALAACGGGGDDPAPASAGSSSETATGDTGSTGSTDTSADTGTDTGTDTASGTPATGNCDVADFKAQALAQVNAFRAQARTCGSVSYPAVPALAWNDKLTQAAYGHSADMAAKNYFSHTSQDGRTYAQRVSATGYTYTDLGENIAAGSTTMSAVMAGWQASEGHCVNLMRPRFTEIGLSCVKGATGATYRTYWTMELAKPR